MDDTKRSGGRRAAMAAALVAGGLLAGGLTAGALTASADTSSSTSSAASGAAQALKGAIDESKSQRPDEHLLTGDNAAKVRAAALAKYPGATILRVETDSDGVYEAHLTTADGQRVTVEVDQSFAVTGLEAAPARGADAGQGAGNGAGQGAAPSAPGA